MKCEACERGDHDQCGMQSWCDCDCEGYDPNAIYLPMPWDLHEDGTFTRMDEPEG